MLTSHPTPPQPRKTIYVTGAQENARFAAFPLGETRLRARRYVRLEPKTNNYYLICGTGSWTKVVPWHMPTWESGHMGRDSLASTQDMNPCVGWHMMALSGIKSTYFSTIAQVKGQDMNGRGYDHMRTTDLCEPKMQSKQWHNHWNRQYPSMKFKEWRICMGHRRPRWIFRSSRKVWVKINTALAALANSVHDRLLWHFAWWPGCCSWQRQKWWGALWLEGSRKIWQGSPIIDYYCIIYFYFGWPFPLNQNWTLKHLVLLLFWVSGPSDSLESKRSSNGPLSKCKFRNLVGDKWVQRSFFKSANPLKKQFWFPTVDGQNPAPPGM